MDIRNNGDRFRLDATAAAFAAALVVLVLAVYLNTLYGGFVYDDAKQIIGNRWITSAAHVPDILSTHTFGFLEDSYQAISYRPMMFLMFMADYALFGLENAWGWHLVSVIVHALNAVMVYVVVSGLLSRRAGGGTSIAAHLPPFAAAAIFAVHPVNSEPVSWIAAQPELSYTLLTLVCFHLYMGSGAGPATGLWRAFKYRALPAFLFLVALLYKETAVALPVMIVVYEALTLKDAGLLSFQRVRRYLPFAASAGVYGAMRYLALKGEVTPSITLHDYLTGPQFVLNAIVQFAVDLRMLLFPAGDYPLQLLDPVFSITDPRALVSVLAALAVPAALVIFRKRVSALHLLAVVFIVLPLLPTLYAPAISYFPYADRYLYFPTIGLGLLVALALSAALARWPAAMARGAVAAFVCWAAVFSFWAAGRNAYWRDDLSLWSASLKGDPQNYAALHSIGVYQVKHGETARGIANLELAIRLNLASPHPHQTMLLVTRKFLSSVYHSNGMLDQAAGLYAIILRDEPESFVAGYNLAQIYQSRGRFRDAIDVYAQALKGATAPGMFREVYNNLGYCYYNLGMRQEALASYERALAYAPGDPVILDNIRRLR